jgi:porin
MNKVNCIFVVFLSFFIVTGYSQEQPLRKEGALHLSGSYIGDLVSNFNGGIKKGTTYLGLANIKLAFDSEKANLWKGGEAMVNVGNAHGGEPSRNLVGDFLGVSNIEAGNLTFMYELWYRQKFGNTSLKVGLQDLNADFATTENSALFTNSTFGIQSSIADNISVPIFPLTALGVHFKWNMAKSCTLQTAVFDGTPDEFGTNPYNLHWKLSKDQGYLLVSEFQLEKSLIKDKSGKYKVGVYYHCHNDSITVEQKAGGLYVVCDQQITDKLSAFSQIGYSPKSKINYNHFYSLGLNYRGVIAKRPKDQLGVAVAYAGIDQKDVGSEMALEMTCQIELSENFYIRPDIQYIINPAGTDVKLDNALVGFVRFGAKF